MRAQVTKGKQRIDFFTIPEYEQWLEQTPDAHKWDSKYYKVCDLPNRAPCVSLVSLRSF
jgi:DNA topoisomerase-2